MAMVFLTSTLTALNAFKTNTEKIIKTPPPFVRSRIKLLLLSGTVCGIEFCYAAETAFVSPILLTEGFPMVLSTIIWCISPLVGFLLVPILGSMSDNCKSPIGRRRPFIIALSCGIVAGLILVPLGAHVGENEERRIEELLGNVTQSENSSSLMTKNRMYEDMNMNIFNGSRNSTKLCITPFCTSPSSIALLVIGIVLLDSCCDACQSPCRAYLLDVTTPNEHAAGLTTFTIMAGLGGSIGYVLGGIDWSASYGANQLTSMEHIRIIFTVALVMFVVLTITSLSSHQEQATTESPNYSQWLPVFIVSLFSRKYQRFENDSCSENCEVSPNSSKVKCQQGSSEENFPDSQHLRNDVDVSHVNGDTGISCHKPVEYGAISKDEDTATPDGARDHLKDGIDVESAEISMDADLRTYLMSIVRMPKTMIILCVTNLFSWMSLVCFSLYFTNYVGVTVYGGDPEAREGTTLRKTYNEGVRHGSLSMALYSITCSFYSIALEKLVNRFGALSVYVCSQLIYTLGSTTMAITGNKIVTIVFSCTAGIMYATLFTMPYMIIAHYHSKNKFEKSEGDTRQILRGLGTDIGIVSSMVFVAQFLLSLIIGSIIDAVKNPIVVIIAAAVLSFAGAISASQVYYGDL